MSVAEYASYDAVGLAELVRKREVSPTELVEAAIERIEKHRMRQPFPKLRLCPILKASCSSLTESESHRAIARRLIVALGDSVFSMRGLRWIFKSRAVKYGFRPMSGNL